MISVIEMANLYDARGSFWSLRPHNTSKLPTQSALGQICMEKWPVPSLAELFLGLQKGPRRSDFFKGFVCYQCNPFLKMSINRRTRGRGEKIQKLELRGPILPIFGCLGPPSKNQSAITPSLLGIRGYVIFEQ